MIDHTCKSERRLRRVKARINGRICRHVAAAAWILCGSGVSVGGEGTPAPAAVVSGAEPGSLSRTEKPIPFEDLLTGNPFTIEACIGLLETTEQQAAAETTATPAELARYNAAADYSTRYAGRAVLIMIDGTVVFDRYDRKWSADQPHLLASGTKSFCGVMAAAAIQDKIIPGWDDVISDTLTVWKADPLKKQITLRHLLTLSSGLDPNDSRLESGGGEMLGDIVTKRLANLKLDKAQSAPDKHQAVLDCKMTGEPGKQFQYGSSHFYAFGAYLEARLAATQSPYKTVEQYFMACIADPIQMKIGGWGKDEKGHLNLPGGAALTAREWVKFGELVRLNGAIRQPDGSLRQLIDPDLLAECFKRSKNNSQYGLTWWLPSDDRSMSTADAGGKGAGSPERAADPPAKQPNPTPPIKKPDGKELKVLMAAGLGKQRLIVLPEQKMVIVRYAEGANGAGAFSDAEFLKLIFGW